MGKKDPRIDAYIAKQRDFAKPILTYLRAVVHEGCPQVEETLKWSSPAFMYEGILAGFAGFKEHAAFGFWRHELLLRERSGEAMGSFGRLTSVKDLPSKKELLALVKKAMELNETGAKAPRMAKKPRKAIPMPADLKAALARNKAAKGKYEDFSPSHRREYLEWITEAKSDDTRARRVKQAVEWMAEGKPRNWKYM
jgi:uncharacterized protein YdeI (YjbR/CyaY-like superfamily)